MTVFFFGERWDAPQVDDAIPVPAPVGTACLRCGEPVVDGDRGLIRATVRMVDGAMVGGQEPIHAECDLIGVLGHTSGILNCCWFHP